MLFLVKAQIAGVAFLAHKNSSLSLARVRCSNGIKTACDMSRMLTEGSLCMNDKLGPFGRARGGKKSDGQVGDLRAKWIV